MMRSFAITKIYMPLKFDFYIRFCSVSSFNYFLDMPLLLYDRFLILSMQCIIYISIEVGSSAIMQIKVYQASYSLFDHNTVNLWQLTHRKCSMMYNSRITIARWIKLLRSYQRYGCCKDQAEGE